MEEKREEKDCQANETAHANAQKEENEFIHLNNKYLSAIYISTISDA